MASNSRKYHNKKKMMMTGEHIEVGDLHIQFPYVPYSCQQDFMKQVVGALESSANAALESPTGTGKTLSLLCSSLAWVQRQKERIRPKQPAAADGLTNPTGDNGTGQAQEKDSSVSSSNPLYPKIYYASRTHSQLQQVIRELNKTAYRSLVRVATLAGRDQLCLHHKVQKETNSELRGHMCRNLRRTKTCFFSNKLESESEAADKMYAEATHGNAIDIEDLIALGRQFHHCPFYRARQMYERADLILLPYTYLLDSKVREMYNIKIKGSILILDEAHNMESQAEESMSVDFSTRTLSSAIRETKRVLNMVMEDVESTRQHMDDYGESFASLGNGKKQKKNDRDSEEQKDISVTRDDVATLLSMLQALEEQIDALDQENGGRQMSNNIPGRVYPGSRMVELLKGAEISRSQRGKICKVIDQIGLFLAQHASRNSGLFAVRCTALSEFSTLISRVFVDTFEGIPQPKVDGVPQQVVLKPQQQDASHHFQLFVERRDTSSTPVERPKWGGGLRVLKRDTDPEQQEDRNEVEEVGQKEIILHYWCFNAGVAMRYLESRGTRSILMASGTLAPLNTFMNTMGIQFGAMLESGHCAREEQLIVGALQAGMNGAELLGTFQKRNDYAYKQTIGELILQLARVTPQGMLVFFPSYSQMGNFVQHWKWPQRTGGGGGPLLWAQMEQYKRLFVEPKERTDVPQLFRDFDDTVRTTPGGALLLAVCRGKLSEGIDFADSHCRAVVIVGIPFPPLFEPKVILKKDHLREQLAQQQRLKATGFAAAPVMNPEYWYKIEGTRAVNQALGRIIRHKDDFGAVILADSRYTTMERRMFPSWMRQSIKSHERPASLLSSIERFFAERGMLVAKSRQNDIERAAAVLRQRNPGGGQKRAGPLMDPDEDEAKRLKDASIVGIYADAIGLKQESEDPEQTIADEDENWLQSSHNPTSSQHQTPSTPTDNDAMAMQMMVRQSRERKRKVWPKVHVSDEYFDSAEPPSSSSSTIDIIDLD